MKTNSIIKSALFVVGFSAFALAGSAQAQILQVDFTDAPDGGTTAPGFTSIGGEIGDPTPLSATIGAYTVNLSGIDGVYASGGGGTVSYANMYDNIAYNNALSAGPAATMTLTVAGLADSTTYDVTVWSYQSAATEPGGTITQFAPGGSTTGQTGTVSSYGATPVPTSNSDYSETLTETTDATGLLTITATGQYNNLNGGFYGRFNGFEIDSVPVEAPEPSTYALMGLGALALLVISRRRRTV